MKKGKVPARSSPDFKNNPFKALKSFIPQPVSPEKKETTDRAKNEKRIEDDTDLFFRAIEGARRIDGTLEKSVVPLKPKNAKEASPDAYGDKEFFLESMHKIGIIFREKKAEIDSETSEPRSVSSRMRQLKRGTIRISHELDLHGFLKDEALKRLEHFIATTFWQGNKAVLIITGKGINSPEGPVLRGAVASWLRESGKGMVAEFYPAPRNMGGNGAFVVFFKKRA
jgi:DNA-nicking Smr family endonuclease